MNITKHTIGAAMILFSALLCFGQTPNDPQPLPPNQVIEREMTGAETHRYKFDLRAGEFFQVRVEQKGVDVALKLVDAGGVSLAQMESPNAKEGFETLSFAAVQAGGFVLEVGGFDVKAEKGIYIINRQASRTATAGDQRRVAIEKLFVAGITARDTAGQSEAAIAKLAEALRGWQELNDEYLIQLTTLQINQLKAAKANAIYDEAFALFGQGTAQSYRAALQKFAEASRLYQEIDDKSENAGISLLASGSIFDRLGEKAAALKQYEKALRFFQSNNYKNWEAGTLNNIGSVYDDLGEKQKALEFYNRALPLRREVGDKGGEATTLNNIGLVYNSLGEKQKALEFYNRALPLMREVGDKGGEAGTLNNMMYVWESLKNGRLAVFYGKQSVNKYQELRQAIQDLDKEIQKVFLGTIEDTYRHLADVLIAEGRFAQAEQILAMLKEQEFFEFVRRDADEIKKLSVRADLQADERAALEKYETLAGKVTEYGTQFVKLEELKNAQGAGFARQPEYDDLKNKLDAANTAFRLFLEKELVAELGKPVKKEIELDRALQGRLQQWGNGTVALYTVVGDDRYRVVLTTPKTQTDGKTEIKIVDLNKKIFAFRAALQNPSIDPRPLGKELYDILIKPIEKDLLAAEAKTLVWSLDGTLRYIPFAALSPDGVHYLAEKYQNVVVTSTTRQSLSAEINPNWRLLGAGVTRESRLTEPNGTQEITFSALPGVGSELLQIISRENANPPENGLMTGSRMLDGEFNLAALETKMSERVAGNKPKYNVIHLATHFRLSGDTAKSFLLLGGNQVLSLDKVSDNTALNFGDVELVTLSACSTGYGTTIENKIGTAKQPPQNNGAEVDSLATFIELRGAKSVLASLWSVSDESTSLLMSEFYRLRKSNPALTKAEAMQQAQLNMISGKLKPSTAEGQNRAEKAYQNGRGDTLSNDVKFPFNKENPFAHPYFWSPFVLIGNWR